MTAAITDLPDYNQANTMVESAGFDSSVAEVHGTICGVLASPQADSTDWMEVALGGIGNGANNVPESVTSQLVALHDGSLESLTDANFSFALLLPDSSSAGIAARTAGVAEWCRGFLLGVSAGGLKEFSSLPEMVREALEDMLDIAEVITEEGEDEQQEKALVELEEYVRVSVQLIFDERWQVAETQ